MFRLAFAQMRRSRGRLAAGGIAVAIGCAFVAVTLLAGDVLTRTTYNSITAEYADADLVVFGPPGRLTAEDVAELANVPGVGAAHAKRSVWVTLRGSDGELVVTAESPATDDRLEAQVLVAGRMPGPGEVALTDRAAESVGAELGDTVAVITDLPLEEDDVPPAQMDVVGVLDGFTLSLTGGVATVLVDPENLEQFAGPATDDLSVLTAGLLAVDGASVPEVREVVTGVLADHVDPRVYVATPDELAERTIREMTQEPQTLMLVALAFAAVALLVAALVIGNTFQVLVAQRTRTLALLRCVGADRSQLRRSVVIEALALGGLAATAGMLLGTAVVQAILVVLGRTAPGVPLPDGAPVSVASVLVPVLVGVAVTVVAALGPARAATRVPPLAALRPADAPRVSERAGRVRAGLAGLLVAAGAGLMGLGVVAASPDYGYGYGLGLALGLGVLGGAVSFVGVLLSAVFWVPRLVGLAASALRPLGVPAQLAGANVTRNPRRVSATSTALLIGVTLVVMMATGATGAKSAIARELDTAYPVDVQVSTSFGDWVPGPVIDAIRTVPGVTEVVTVRGAVLSVTGAVPSVTAAAAPYDGFPVLAPDETAIALLREPGHLAELADDTIVIPQAFEWAFDGVETLTLSLPPADSAAREPVQLRVVVGGLPGSSLMVTPNTLNRLGPSTVNTLWVELERRDAATTVSRIEAEAARSDRSLMVAGLAAVRQSYEAVVDTVLAVVVGLLAVSVLIALIGVANTLSLSVLERRRESATLRAIGLTRRRLRATLALEGMLIAVVGAVAGSALGTAYGWVGTRIVLEQMGAVGLVVAWRDIALAVLVAAAAGVLASVLPGRRAARSAPVTALAVE